MINKLTHVLSSITTAKTPAAAKTALQHISIMLYCISIANLLIALITENPDPIMDAWFILLLSITLRHNQSRAGAIDIMIYPLYSIAGSIYCQYYLLADARSIILNTVVIVLSLPAIYATYQYHHLLQSQINWKNLLIKTIHALLYFVLFAIFTQFIILSKYGPFLYDFGGYQLLALISLLMPSIGVFLAFNGWLPFTRHEPVCRFSLKIPS